MIKVSGALKSKWLTSDKTCLGLYLGSDEDEIRKNAIDAMVALDEFLNPWSVYGEIPEPYIDVELKRDDGEIIDGFLVTFNDVNQWHVDGAEYHIHGPEIIGWRYPAPGGRRWRA